MSFVQEFDRITVFYRFSNDQLINVNVKLKNNANGINKHNLKKKIFAESCLQPFDHKYKDSCSKENKFQQYYYFDTETHRCTMFW